MFSKQPLVKTLFSVALIIFFYAGFTYIVMEPLGLGTYDIDVSTMWLAPGSEASALRFFACFSIIANLTFLSVAYIKLLSGW